MKEEKESKEGRSIIPKATGWKCKGRTQEELCGKIPADPEALMYVVLNRAKESGMPVLPEEVKMKAKAEIAEVVAGRGAAKAKEAAKGEPGEPEGEEEAQAVTFYIDEKGIYLKPIDIVGMLKEKARQMGLTIKYRGLVGAFEGLKITPLRIYLMRGGKHIEKPEGRVPKPIHKAWGKPSITVSDTVKPGAEFEFEVVKRSLSISDDDFETILKECNRLGGLRKEYGSFEWVEVKRLKD